MIVSRKEAEEKLGKELRGPKYAGKRWFLLSRSLPHRNLGGFATKQEAKNHERAVQFFKRNPTPVPEGVRDKNLWLRSREKVKKRVSVWPSAYASGQVVQEYKRAGGRYYNPSAPLTKESILELELAAIENPMTGLDKWFAEEWVDLARSVYLKGDKAGHLKPGGWVKCGRPDTTKGGYPKCRPLAEAKRMTPEQRLYAIRKKRKVERKASKKPGRAPIMVKTYKKKSNPDSNPERKKLYIYPNKSSVKVAKRALERRKRLPKSKRGGLDAMEAHEQGIGSGVLRARDIAAGKRINAYQVKAFFDRHRHNFVKAKADGKKWEDSKAWQAWDLWGGEPLRKQVEAAVKKDKAKRDKEERKKNPAAKKKKVKKKIKKVEEQLSEESHAMTKGAAIGTAVGGLAGAVVAPPVGGPIGAGAGAYTGAMIGKEMANNKKATPNPKRKKKKKKSKEAKVRDWLAVHAQFRTSAGETKGPGGKSKARRSKEGARGQGQKKAIAEQNPYRKERFEHEGVPADLKEPEYESWADWEARQGMYTGPIPPDPREEKARRAKIKSRAKAKLQKLKGNPGRPPLAKDLIAECRKLWESYCKRPGRVTLRKVEKHCDTMKASKFKTVKDERRRCMNAVRREKKKLGM